MNNKKVFLGSVAELQPAAGLKRRPMQQRSLERIDTILTATEEELAENGYEGLSVVAIAERAGIRPTSIYHYFNSLEAILITLMTRGTDTFLKLLTSSILNTVSTENVLDRFAEGVTLGWTMYSSDPVSRGLWAASRHIEALRQIDQQLNEQLAKVFCEQARKLAPETDLAALETAFLLAVSLSSPVFELAMPLPEKQQERLLASYCASQRQWLSELLQPQH